MAVKSIMAITVIVFFMINRFLFLIPAITMRLFAEERRMQTMELLLTKPLTDIQIVLAKYIAGLVLLLFSLLPTLVYYYSIVQLGDPIGNIDSGGTIGSYIGLFFLGASFFTDNVNLDINIYDTYFIISGFYVLCFFFFLFLFVIYLQLR